MQTLLALVAGLLVGGLFAGLRLPLPAPPTFTGIMGAFGVFLGSQLYAFAARLLAQASGG